ncbi:hypothetical protein NH340_JMT08791 [Sarcoptes scabiei]|nr:hypothetical protein NH340_JMT08791 [Sarcoptes scabiei]
MIKNGDRNNFSSNKENEKCPRALIDGTPTSSLSSSPRSDRCRESVAELPEQILNLLRTKQFVLIGYINQGSTSIVYKVQRFDQYFAAKIIDRLRISDLNRKIFLPNEIRISKQIHHPNIVATEEIIESFRYTIIINEYATDGDLVTLMERNERPPLTTIKRWITEIVQALHYLHSKGIAHLDIKADNILLCDGVAKLCDFTYAQYCRDPSTQEIILSTNFCGTIEYKAPETLFCNKPYNPLIADCFSLGVLIYTMLTYEFPFGFGPELRTPEGLQKLHEEICHKNWSLNDDLENDRRLYSLLRQLLNPDIDERITIEQVIHHPWFIG